MSGEEKSGGGRSGRAISLRLVYRVVIAVSCVLAICLLIAAFQTTRSYQRMQHATDEYITCQKYAEELKEGSDYMTEEVRAFAVNGKKVHVQNYFREVHVTCRRDKAMKSLDEYLSQRDAERYLRTALTYSDRLMGLEFYSMRLVIESRGYDLSAYPVEIQNTKLEKEDLRLSSHEQAEKARDIVFDEVYRSYKDDIDKNVVLCVEDLIAQTHRQLESSSQSLFRVLRRQEILMFVTLFLLMCIVLLTLRMAILPLRRFVDHIHNHEELPPTSAYELTYLADAYNKMLAQTQSSHEKLSYEAEHDTLTGLYNRGVFDRVRETSDPSQIALMLIDVDMFKGINDNYGHDIGDKILQKVANLLSSSFRSDDYVCRVGGDEFAVIMVHVTSELKYLVRQKLEMLSAALAREEDGLPKVTLSIGVAFGDRENPEGDIYQDADTALYRVKRAGRNGFEFY